jgi:hypothetical protein
MATMDAQGESPEPSSIPPSGVLPKLPQTIFILETDDYAAASGGPETQADPTRHERRR